MEIICTQENFKKAIFNTERVTGKQITLPILGNILLETENGRLKLSATNLEVGIISRIGAKINKEGKITIPAKLLSSFINNLPSGDKIELKTENQVLQIKSGSYKAKIKGLDAQDFPIIPKMQDNFILKIPAQRIKEIISRILMCISINETRPELTGVNMRLLENEVSLAATDSFRLAEEIINITDNEKGVDYSLFISKTNSLIIPASTFSEIIRIITPEIEEVKIIIEESQIFFKIDDVVVVSRLINGKYPEYKQIMPSSFNTRAVLKKEDVARALKIASAFINNKAGEINFSINPEKNKVTIEYQSQEIGGNVTELAADIIGPEQNIVFNPRYILDGISPLPSSQVAFLMNNNSSPVAIKMLNADKGDIFNDYTYIVMPIKN